MGYSIRTKDGIVIKNIPDNIPKDDPSLKKRVQDIRASRGMEAPPTALESVGRGLSSVARGAAIPLTGAALGGAAAGPIGAVAGSLALPAAELVSKGLGTVGIETGSPYEMAQRGLTKLGFPEPQTTTERALQAGGEALGGVGGQLGALSKLATTATSPVGRGVAQQLSTLPERQLAASIPAGATGQIVGEKTDSPIAGIIAGTVAGLPFGIKAPKQTEKVPTIAELKKQSNVLYEEAKNSGVVFKKQPFKQFVNKLESELVDDMGLDADIQPAAFKALKRLKESSNTNNSLKEIENLRRIAGGAAGSTNASERTIAKKIIDDLDDFVETADPNKMVAGTKEGIEAITNARNTWKLAKKGEILEDLFDSAKLRAEGNYTQSGMENALRRKLINLADNKKQMRAFTQDEQKAIRSAAQGGPIQNFYRNVGKYATKSPLPTAAGAGMGAYIGSTIGGPVGGLIGAAIPGTVGNIARQRATSIGLEKFRNLEDMLKLGRAPMTRPTPRQILGTRGGIMGLEQGLLQPDE
jgi:hypothetical protein